MIMCKRLPMAFLVAVIGFLGIEAGGHLWAPGQISFVPAAEAVVGRPLTPVSVAGRGQGVIALTWGSSGLHEPLETLRDAGDSRSSRRLRRGSEPGPQEG